MFNKRHKYITETFPPYLYLNKKWKYNNKLSISM